jgi:hypothetical protein
MLGALQALVEFADSPICLCDDEEGGCILGVSTSFAAACLGAARGGRLHEALAALELPPGVDRVRLGNDRDLPLRSSSGQHWQLASRRVGAYFVVQLRADDARRAPQAPQEGSGHCPPPCCCSSCCSGCCSTAPRAESAPALPAAVFGSTGRSLSIIHANKSLCAITGGRRHAPCRCIAAWQPGSGRCGSRCGPALTDRGTAHAGCTTDELVGRSFEDVHGKHSTGVHGKPWDQAVVRSPGEPPAALPGPLAAPRPRARAHPAAP